MKSAICLLIATAQAAFPAYTTSGFAGATATAVEIQTLGQNPYACLREGLEVVWDIAAEPDWAYTTAADWFGTSTQSPSAVETAGDTWSCCALSANGVTACPSYVESDGATPPVFSHTAAITTSVETAAFYDGATTNMVGEFLLAAAYQMLPTAAGRVIDTDYCDNQSTLLVADAEPVTLMTGGLAFTGLTKCTYFLTAAADSAPAFKLTASHTVAATAFWDYDLVVAEYFVEELVDFSAAATPYVLPADIAKVPLVVASAAPTPVDYMTNGSPLPMMNGCAFAAINYSKAMWEGYNDLDGQSYSCMDQMYSVHFYGEFVEQYNEKLEMFNEEQTTYNEQMALENTRRGDFFANMFDEKIMVPHRPSTPWTPAPYEGVTAVYVAPAPALDNVAYFPAVATRDAVITEWIGHLETHGMTMVGETSTDGFLATGHVFGMTGQGAASMPGADAKAYTNHILLDGTGASAAAVMMVSIFPFDATTAGVATMDISLEATSVPFHTMFTELPFFAMVPVAPTVDLTASVDGAKALTAGVAVAALALSLF